MQLGDDHGPITRARVVHEEATVRFVVRMQRKPQQAAFAVDANPIGEIQKWLRPERPVRLDDPDPASMRLTDEEVAIRRRGDGARLVEAIGDQLESQLGRPAPARREWRGARSRRRRLDRR